MLQYKTKTLLLGLGLLFLQANAFAVPSAKVIMEKAERLRIPHESYQSKVSIVDEKNGKKAPATVYRSKINPKYGALVEFLEPESDLGKKMLMVDENMWIKFPRSAKPLKVSARQKLMGNAANGDITGISYQKSYDYTFLKTLKEKGRDLYVLDLRAKAGKMVTYDRIEYYIDQKTFRPVRSHFMTKTGKVIRVASYLDYKKLNGLERATVVKINSYINKNHITYITFSDFKEQSFASILFKKEYLGR